jgi:hypothetical protein
VSEARSNQRKTNHSRKEIKAMNYQNQVLANAFSKALISNTAAPRYAKMPFVDLVSATVLTKTFQRAIKAADSLFGISADENKAVSRKVKHAKRAAKKHAKKQVKSAKEVTMSDTDTNTPKRKRGRPAGSKNKPKVAPVTEPTVAESKPLFVDIEEPEPTDEDTPLNEL